MAAGRFLMVGGIRVRFGRGGCRCRADEVGTGVAKDSGQPVVGGAVDDAAVLDVCGEVAAEPSAEHLADRRVGVGDGGGMRRAVDGPGHRGPDVGPGDACAEGEDGGPQHGEQVARGVMVGAEVVQIRAQLPDGARGQ